MLLLQAKTNILSSKYFSNEICEKIEQFTGNINISENLLESINIAYNKLTTTNDCEAFYLLFYSTVILNSSTYLCPLESPYSTLLAQKLADTIFYIITNNLRNKAHPILSLLMIKKLVLCIV